MSVRRSGGGGTESAGHRAQGHKQSGSERGRPCVCARVCVSVEVEVWRRRWEGARQDWGVKKVQCAPREEWEWGGRWRVSADVDVPALSVSPCLCLAVCLPLRTVLVTRDCRCTCNVGTRTATGASTWAGANMVSACSLQCSRAKKGRTPVFCKLSVNGVLSLSGWLRGRNVECVYLCPKGGVYDYTARERWGQLQTVGATTKDSCHACSQGGVRKGTARSKTSCIYIVQTTAQGWQAKS